MTWDVINSSIRSSHKLQNSGQSGVCQKNLVKLGNQDRFWTMRNLPAAKSVPAKKREKGVEKLCVLACVKEPCRDMFYSKVTNLREVLFDDHI